MRAQSVIHRLHALGVALSIDDFGTGYTSLAYLRDLPVQEIKIDRSFVTSMLSVGKDAVIVRTGVELAHRLGLDSVAEGIEDAETLSALSVLGCTIAQGYHLGRPMSFEAFDSWLVTWAGVQSPDPVLPAQRTPEGETRPRVRMLESRAAVDSAGSDSARSDSVGSDSEG